MSKSNPLTWCCDVCNYSPLTINPAEINCPNCGPQYFFINGLWECDDTFTPADFPASRSDHLQVLEKNHFWFEARDRLLRTKLLSLKRPDDQNLLELGCGSGRVLTALTDDFAHTTGIEGHLSALETAVTSCPDSHLLHANILNTPLTEEQFDWVVAFDVLEHVDPVAFLKEALRLARPGGRLLISVPAFPLLWSHVDKLAGHRCRYRLKQLTEELDTVGWRLQGHTYFQFLLFPLLATSRLFNRNKQSEFERNPPIFINRLFRIINQLEVSLFQRLTLPFGSSLIIWAEKPTTATTDYD